MILTSVKSFCLDPLFNTNDIQLYLNFEIDSKCMWCMIVHEAYLFCPKFSARVLSKLTKFIAVCVAEHHVSFQPSLLVCIRRPCSVNEKARTHTAALPHQIACWIASCLSMSLFASRRRNLHLQYRRFTGYASLFSDETYLEKSVPKNRHFYKTLALLFCA